MRANLLLLIALVSLSCSTYGGRTGESGRGGTTVSLDHAITRQETVFLLHGVCKSPLDMIILERTLRKRGFQVVNWGYPSRNYPVSDLADQLAAEVARHPCSRIDFVTHSMGTIVARTYIQRYKPGNLGRFVMLGPPNQGAQMASRLRKWIVFKLLLGPAGQDLCRGSEGKCASAGIPPCEFGIIAGGTGHRIGLNPFLPGDNDLIVTMEETRLDGAKDTMRLACPHVLLPLVPKSVRAVISFLETGQFGGQSGDRNLQ